MRIVMVVPGGVDRSGRQRVIPALLCLIERLARQHELMVVATSQEPVYSEYDLLGARVVCLGDAAGQLPALKFFRRYGQLQQALRRFGARPDLFHAVSAAEIGALTGLVGRRMNVPVVTSVFSGELTWLPEIRYGRQGTLQGRLAVRLALGLASEVSAGSRFAGEPLSRTQWHWVPLGVDTDRFAAPVRKTPGPPWRLMHVAHINPVKDQATLLRAVRRIAEKQPVQLDWFGEDTLGGRLQAQAASSGMAGLVHFHGVRPLEELLPYYRQAHLMLQTSRHESQGVAVCEAAATGVPTVGTAVGLVAELAPDAAVAVPVGDDAALAASALAVLSDEKKREELGTAARAWAQRHNADWTAAEFEKIYTGCTGV